MTNGSSYRDALAPKEVQCRALMEQAKEALEQNNGLPSKEEFHYLSQAAKIRAELAKLTTGQARTIQLKKLQELKHRREEIAKYLDPEGYITLVEKNKAEAESNKPAEGSNSTTNAHNITKKSNDTISDEEVASWFAKKPTHGFADVAGMKDLMERLSNCALGAQWNKIKAFLKMPTVHTYFFYGLPGCGKTFIANAFAHELMNENYSYMTLTGGKIMSSKVGVAEKTIERVFEEAKKHAPCILFIDEIDGVCADRNDDNTPQYARSLTTSFLTGYNSLKEFEKAEKDADKKIIFIAATNYPELVDSAMLDRAELIYVEIPDQEARCHSFRLKYSDIFQLEEGFDYMEMAERTEGYNYRDLDRLEEHLKDKAFSYLRSTYTNEDEAYNALVNGEFRLTREIFDEAFDAYEPTPKDKEKEAMQKWREKVSRN